MFYNCSFELNETDPIQHYRLFDIPLKHMPSHTGCVCVNERTPFTRFTPLSFSLIVSPSPFPPHARTRFFTSVCVCVCSVFFHTFLFVSLFPSWMSVCVCVCIFERFVLSVYCNPNMCQSVFVVAFPAEDKVRRPLCTRLRRLRRLRCRMCQYFASAFIGVSAAHVDY